MAFNTKKFMQTKFEYRTDKVKVPDMKEFFEDGEPEFTVRGLDGTEFTNIKEAAERQRNIASIMEGILSTAAREKTEALRKSLGISDSVPVELAKRLEMLVVGSVEPKVEMDLSVKIARVYPIEFYTLTTKILELTGLGQSPLGKSQPSGKATESEQPSTSATPINASSSK